MASPRPSSPRKIVNALLTTYLLQGTFVRAIPFQRRDPPFGHDNSFGGPKDHDEGHPINQMSCDTTILNEALTSYNSAQTVVPTVTISFTETRYSGTNNVNFASASVEDVYPAFDTTTTIFSTSTVTIAVPPITSTTEASATSSHTESTQEINVAPSQPTISESSSSSTPLSSSSFFSSANDSPSGALFAEGSSSSTSAGAATSTGSASSPIVVFTTSSIQIASSEISVSLVGSSVLPSTSGSVITQLGSSGISSVVPFATSVISTPVATLSPTSIPSASVSITVSALAGNIFVPMASDPPPAQITSRSDHPIPKVGISSSDDQPIETNKFYANLMLNNQTSSVWTFPYSLRWSAGQDSIGSWGIAMSHVELSQFQYGPGTPASYYVTPVGIDSMILSASEFGAGTVLTTDAHEGFSVIVNLAPSSGATPILALPLVQGMGFVTGVYTSATPLIQSGVLFRELSPLTRVGASWKCSVSLYDGTTWLVYITPDGDGSEPTVTLTSSSTITGPAGFNGIIQIAKLSGGSDGEAAYDGSAGVYAISGTIAASLGTPSILSGAGIVAADYSLSWTKAGNTSKTLIMFALPHHVQSFSGDTINAPINNVTLQTTTKGIATAVLADSWNMTEILPTNMTFAPWSPTYNSVTVLPEAAIALVNSSAASELSEDMPSQTDLDSLYFSGKGLAKFAAIVYTANDLAQNPGLAAAGLAKLKDALATFISNTQQTPIVYDTVWKGAVSNDGYANINNDFGNTGYNDHHFHYGYFVYTAAVIAYLDPDWLVDGTNKVWIDMLVRDFANPSTNDPYYPFSRMFDWYHGHSWAAGVFESGAGKNQESSSEDSFASYAIKMWGKVTGDANMEARGNLMLAIQARSFTNYILMQSDNTVEPANFIGNKAVGITFEEKDDHTTYFGTNIEYIEGIHMLPLAPNSGLTRAAEFVQEEWDTYFSNGRVDSIAGGWRGILYANLAFIDPVTSWEWFSDSSFDPQYLDGGASRTWYLALSASLGGVQ